MRLATSLAVTIMACKTKEELSVARGKVQAAFDKDPLFKKEWKEWLIDIRDSKAWELGLPDTPFEDTLNAAGKKAFKKGELCGKQE